MARRGNDAPSRPASLLAAAYQRHPGWFAFAAAWIVYALTASWTHVWNSDVEASVWPAYQLASTGRPWLEGTPFSDDSIFFIEANGHVVSNRQIGIILAAVPFYVLTGSPPSVWPAALAAATITAGAVGMMHSALRALVPASVAVGASLVMAVGSPTWSVSADGMWSHTVTQFAIAAAAFSASRNRWLLAGAVLGLGIMARPHLAVIPFVLGIGVGWSRRDWAITAKVGIASGAAGGALLALNHWIYGQWTLTGYGSYVAQNLGGLGELGGLDDGSTASTGLWKIWQWLPDYALNWIGFLIAPDRGLFVWTPIALVLLPAAWRAWRAAPDWVSMLAIGGLVYSAVQLRINHFHGVDTFIGYRHALELLTCLVPLFALAWMQTQRAWVRGLVAGLFVYQVCAMAVGASFGGGVLTVNEVWRDNTLLFMVRTAPRVAGPLAFVALLLAVLAGFRVGGAARPPNSTGPLLPNQMGPPPTAQRMTRLPPKG